MPSFVWWFGLQCQRCLQEREGREVPRQKFEATVCPVELVAMRHVRDAGDLWGRALCGGGGGVGGG
jgi:hypothetical protein